MHDNSDNDDIADPTEHFMWTTPTTGIDRDKTDLWTKRYGTSASARDQWMLAQSKAGISGEALLMRDGMGGSPAHCPMQAS